MLANRAYSIHFKPLINAFHMESMEAFQTSQQQILLIPLIPIRLFIWILTFYVRQCFFCKVFRANGAFLIDRPQIINRPILLFIKVGRKNVQLSLTQSLFVLDYICYTSSSVISFIWGIDPLFIRRDSASIKDGTTLLNSLFNHIDHSLNLL